MEVQTWVNAVTAGASRLLDLAMSPPRKLILKLGKFGPELTLIRNSRKLPQLPLICLTFKMDCYSDELLPSTALTANERNGGERRDDTLDVSREVVEDT